MDGGVRMIELPATPIQADAITDAAKTRGMSVTDWALDCLLTYASNHLGRGLGDWITLEAAAVERGDYPPCGAQKTVGEGTAVEHTFTCIRIRNHRIEAAAGRDAHAGYDRDHETLTTWEHE